MTRDYRALLFALATIFSSQTMAQSTPQGLQPFPEPPPPPPERVESGETLEPDVRIVRGERKTVTEYRINGQLRAVKVEPKGYPAYWLVDGDGDGNLERRVNDLDPHDFAIPHWVLFSW